MWTGVLLDNTRCQWFFYSFYNQFLSFENDLVHCPYLVKLHIKNHFFLLWPFWKLTPQIHTCMPTHMWLHKHTHTQIYMHPPTLTVKLTNDTKRKNLHGLSPRVNYTDRATAACRRSDCQLFADSGCHVVSVTDPHGRILGFRDRNRYFSIK
jgi:hypothetical protein